MSTAIAPVTEDRDAKRSMALLKAIGLDRVPPEQRELALAIAKRYELDLLLKHLVLVDGRPYITRDGLLHVAHRSGQLDGIEVTDAELVRLEGVGEFWRSTASVYRKDMSRPFRYQGRYPAKGGNQRYAPEMAVKVAEVMALRRAFDVSAPVIEERWDVDPSQVVALEPEQPLAESIAARRAAITSGPATPAGHGAEQGAEEPPSSEPPHPAEEEAGARASSRPAGDDSGRDPDRRRLGATGRGDTPVPALEDAGGEVSAPGGDAPTDPARPSRCAGFSETAGRCEREAGHQGNHKSATETWA